MDKKGNQHNPFDFTHPVKDPSYFAGRAEELKDIEYYLELSKSKRPQFVHLALIGARSAGKSSLLNMISNMANRRGFLPVKISLNNELVENDALFYKEVLDSILTEGKKRGFLDSIRPSGNSWTGW